MFKFYLASCALAMCAVSGGPDSTSENLPSWIAENPGYVHPVEVDSIKEGGGRIGSEGGEAKGWLIFLNEKAGHGIEVDVSDLSLDPESNDFLLISTWPLTAAFKQAKMYTGQFAKPLKKLRIPNSKTFFVLYSPSPNTKAPKMALTYRRYGISLELNQLPTENPVKKKGTVYEIQLKGKPPEEYSVPDFQQKVKEGIRAAARRYAAAHGIPFNEEMKTEEMVSIHKISFCPFEWPERHICASIQHSVFVSGERIPDTEIIMNYQLITDHLRLMWEEETFKELQDLGITVFRLPPTYQTAIYWALIIGLVIFSSVIGGCIFWKVNQINVSSFQDDPTASEQVKKIRKPKLKLAKHQRVPSFMYDSHLKRGPAMGPPTGERIPIKPEPEDVGTLRDNPTDLPFKNYLGSILFSSSRAFDDDDEGASEKPRPKNG